ncbi:sulfite exporter TauE/SafE family protein [Aggregatilineales bacterium SYSU G02658]
MLLTMAALDAVLGLFIGLSLGLLGGGGAILTVPALVYLVGQTPQAAVTASLVIVGTNSAMGAYFHRLQGTVNWRVALLFGGVGMIVAYFAAGLSRSIPPQALMVMFASLMLVVGLYMLFSRSPQQRTEPRGLPVILAAGGLVGLVAGFLGVGGGFLIVPALVLLVGLPMQQAVGTSLVVIAMNSLAGFMGHIGGAELDLLVVGIFAAAGLVGTLIGARLAHRVEPSVLRRLFALFVVVLGILLLIDNLRQLLTA